MQLRPAWISMLVQVGLCGLELVMEDQPLSNTDFLWEPEMAYLTGKAMMFTCTVKCSW